MRMAVGSLMAVLLLAGCTGDGEPAEVSAAVGALPDSFPDDFPLPPDSTLTSTGDAPTLHVDASVEDVQAFYADALPEAGWVIVSDWDGVDISGDPTIGFTFERGEELGVLSISDGEDQAVLRINLQQPFNDPNRGMGAPGPRTPPEPDE
jgi:hypothetical protein